MSAQEPVQTGGAKLGNRGVSLPSAVSENEFYQSDDDQAYGRTQWAISGGNIPLKSTGAEPVFTSHDKLCLLNISPRLANIRMFIYFEDTDSIGPFQLTLAPRRVRHIRFNDLIFPIALPLATAYSAVIQSDVPIIVQFTRADTRQKQNAIMGCVCYADDNDDAGRREG